MFFFSSVAHRLNSKVYQSTFPKFEFVKYLNHDQKLGNSMYIYPCTENEVAEVIAGLQTGKASDIPIQLVKLCSLFLLDHLYKFCDYFLTNGIFPNILKKALISPIHKKGDCRYLDNYRPVSTLPLFGKILEKLIYSRLYNYFLSNGTIYENQFGFRKHHSTSHAINFSVNYILNEIEKRNHVIGIFIDLSKAFDTISHEKLLYKLSFYGIRGQCLSLMKSYLSDRIQTTKFQSVHSDQCISEFGVPQGSVLGPLLFLIYINDIVNSTLNGKFVLFADDTNIFVSGSSEQEAYDKASVVIDKLHEYMYDNQLHINIDKTCFMHFRPELSNEERMQCARTRSVESIYSLYINGKKIKKVSNVKFLGIVIDDKLNWEAHLEYLQNKFKLSIVLIKRIKRVIPETEYMKIYDALFSSYLTYCITVWGGIASYRLAKIFSLQKRCIRLLFGTEITYDHPEFYETCARSRSYNEHKAPKSYVLEHTKPLFNKYNILSLDNLYKYHSFMEIFKLLKYKAPLSLYKLFITSTRAHMLTLNLPLVRLDKSKQNFVFSATLNWNNIAENVFEKCVPLDSGPYKGTVVPGSAKNSDVSASSTVIKSKVKRYMLTQQKIGDKFW